MKKSVWAGLLAIMLPLAGQATIIFNGVTTNITTVLTPTQTVSPHIALTNGAVVNWNTGAGYTGAINDGIGFSLSGTSRVNLNNGSVAITDAAGAGDAALIRLLNNFSGSVTMTGGTYDVTDSNAKDAVFISSANSAASGSTASFSGGTANISETGAGFARLFRMGNYANVNVSGGTYNMNEANGGSLTVFNITGANSSMTVSGGTYNLTTDGPILLIALNAGELTLSGGDFNDLLNKGMTGSVTNNSTLVLDGTFAGLANGTYTDATWVDGAVSGTLADGNTISLSSLKIENGTTGIIQIIPEPATLGMIAISAFGILAFRRMKI